MAGPKPSSNRLRLVAVSAFSAPFAPLVFTAVIVLRVVRRRTLVHYRHWSKRLEHEIARWT
jgi:hypothetical protein